MSDKDLKKHYKRLSLKLCVAVLFFTVPASNASHSHPDKLKLAENQTKEQADEHFVNLTKAYKTCVQRDDCLGFSCP
jgi:translocation protein SEC63